MSGPREAVTEALLETLGLPTKARMLEAIRSKGSRVKVYVSHPGPGDVFARAAAALLREMSRGAGGKIMVVEERVDDWPRGLPWPGIRVEGPGLRGRFVFYGVPSDLLEAPFAAYLAAAAGAWSPGGEAQGERVCGRLRLYVVPGFPCVRAMIALLPLVAASGDAVLEVVNVETMLLEGMKAPVSRVPAFEGPEGGPVARPVKDAREAAELWRSLAKCVEKS